MCATERTCISLLFSTFAELETIYSMMDLSSCYYSYTYKIVFPAPNTLDFLGRIITQATLYNFKCATNTIRYYWSAILYPYYTHGFRQTDRELIRLTSLVSVYMRSFDPSTPVRLLQQNSETFARFCSLIGVENAVDATREINHVILKQVNNCLVEHAVLTLT